VSRLEKIALGEVSVVLWRAVRGSGAMMEKSRSNFSLRLETASFKAMIEFGWSLERREVFAQLGRTGGGAVDREKVQFVCWGRGAW